jgi:hypothetical protein
MPRFPADGYPEVEIVDLSMVDDFCYGERRHFPESGLNPSSSLKPVQSSSILDLEVGQHRSKGLLFLLCMSLV